MRIYTLALSVVAHLIAVMAIVAMPLYATSTLPDPRRVIEFVQVVAVIPSSPPPLMRSVSDSHPTSGAPTVPLAEPRGLEPEPDAPIPVSFDTPPAIVDGLAFAGVPVSADAIPPPPPQPAEREPIRVGGTISRPERIHAVPPVYPPIAQAAHVEGTVVLEAIIGADGAVRDVRVLRSIPLLDYAASEAVRQWLFTPTRLNGDPVPVVMTVTVTFRLR